MKLKLKSNRVTFLSFVDISSLEGAQEVKDFSMSVEPVFTSDHSSFVILFNLQLNVHEEKVLFIEYESCFECADVEDFEEFSKSHFPQVNAPAIAFPFLRSFIGTMLLNAGYEPIFLPSINFSAMFAESEKADKKVRKPQKVKIFRDT